MTITDLIPGATYGIDYPGEWEWKGLAIYRGVDVFAGYAPGSLCFDCLGANGEPDAEGVFDIEHVKALAQHQGSLLDQLAELHRIATKLKLYDAADWLRGHLKP